MCNPLPEIMKWGCGDISCLLQPQQDQEPLHTIRGIIDSTNSIDNINSINSNNNINGINSIYSIKKAVLLIRSGDVTYYTLQH